MINVKDDLYINDANLELKIFGDSEAVAKGKWKLGENIWTPTHELDHSTVISRTVPKRGKIKLCSPRQNAFCHPPP